MKFEVLMAMKFQVAVFCIVTPCSDVQGYKIFRRTTTHPCSGWKWLGLGNWHRDRTGSIRGVTIPTVL